jgi:hypothetical protein
MNVGHVKTQLVEIASTASGHYRSGENIHPSPMIPLSHLPKGQIVIEQRKIDRLDNADTPTGHQPKSRLDDQRNVSEVGPTSCLFDQVWIWRRRTWRTEREHNYHIAMSTVPSFFEMAVVKYPNP